MRRHVLVPALVLVLVGCGRSGPGRLIIEPEQPIARAKALALVRAGTLREADLPGYRAARPKADDEDLDVDAAMTECMGRTARTYAVEDPGYEFAKGGVVISSSVNVASTRTQAEDDLADMRNPAMLDCFEASLRKEMAALPPGVTLPPFAMRHVPVSIPGSDGAFGFTVSITVAGGDEKVTLSMVVLGALVGHAEIEVSAYSEGRVPTPNELEGLLAKAVGRVKKVS